MEKRILQVVIVVAAILIVVVVGRAQTRWALPVAVRVAVVSGAFTPKEREQIAGAVEAWKPLLPAGLTLVLGADVVAIQTCAGCVTISREPTPGKERGETTAFNHDGLTDYATIRIDPRARGSEFRCAVEHEIGHALGLMTHYANSVMQERSSKRHPAEIDAEKLRSIYSLVRYSFRRVVVDGVRRRESVFTYNDAGELMETAVVGDAFDGIPAFPIGTHVSNASVPTYAVAWKLGDSLVSGGDGLWFPVEAWSGSVHVTFSDYRLFRTSVNIREVSNGDR